MSTSATICDIDPELKTVLKKFRHRKEKNNAALVVKINPAKLLVYLDETFENNISVDELREELPEHFPVYVVYSYVLKHSDGRVSYPLIFIYISPAGSKPALQMMYAGSKLKIVEELEITKVFELRSTEEFTEEWLQEKLSFFR